MQLPNVGLPARVSWKALKLERGTEAQNLHSEASNTVSLCVRQAPCSVGSHIVSLSRLSTVRPGLVSSSYGRGAGVQRPGGNVPQNHLLTHGRLSKQCVCKLLGDLQ